MSGQTRGINGHWVRYGIAGDQCYLIDEFKDTYDLLVINGNMLAYMSSSISQFITQKAQKPYIVDPQTHALAYDLELLQSTSKKSEGQIKRSWKKLIDKYGNIPKTALLSENPRPVSPADFDDYTLRGGFTEAVLCFQHDTIQRELEDGEDSEYLKFILKETGASPASVPPAYLIAPYFFINGANEEEWLRLNVRFVEEAKKIVTQNSWKMPIAAEIVITLASMLSKETRKRIVENYASVCPDLVMLWIDDFSEHDANEETLKAYICLLEEFGGYGIKVANLFGGFFSIATMRFSDKITNLIAVCHGLEYGERKPVVPLGGGTPVAKFYSRNLHHRLPPRVAIREMQAIRAFSSRDAFLEGVCDCRQCKETIRDSPSGDVDKYFETKASAYWRGSTFVSNEFPTASASDLCTKHYMWCKEWEYKTLIKTIDELKNDFKNFYDLHGNTIGEKFASHPLIWSKSLQ